MTTIYDEHFRAVTSRQSQTVKVGRVINFFFRRPSPDRADTYPPLSNQEEFEATKSEKL